MKKLLLLAAVAMAFGASAQTLTLDWKQDISSHPAFNTRQGVGINGKIYVNDASTQEVWVYSAAGKESTPLPGGLHTAMNTDEAGNLIISTSNAFPGVWRTDTVCFKVYNPATPDVCHNYTLPYAEMGPGRTDALGKAIGDMTDNGVIYFSGNASTGIHKLVIDEGEVSADYSYVAAVTSTETLNVGVKNTQIVYYPFVENNVEKLLYVNRSAAPIVLIPDSNNTDNFIPERSITCPSKGNSQGAEIFVLGNDEYIIYPAKTEKALGTNYLDAFAITKVGDEAYTVVKEEELAAAPNASQTNWLNVEVVDEYTAKIYQTLPGAFCAQYTFSLPHEGTGINDVTAKKAEVKKVIENGQIYIINGDAKYNVMGAQVK